MFRRFSLPCKRTFDARKAALEFRVGGAQCGLRINLQMPREINHCEHEVADFLGGSILAAARDRGRNFLGFFGDLVEHGLRVVPVEPDRAGLGLQLQRALKRGQSGRHAR